VFQSLQSPLKWQIAHSIIAMAVEDVDSGPAGLPTSDLTRTGHSLNPAGSEVESMTGKGEAGRRGDKVRSDCWISVTPSDGDGLTIELRSKVDALYGADIRRLIQEGCAALGVTDAVVVVEDQGALPFVLAARLEAAVRRANPDCVDQFLLPLSPRSADDSPRERPRRSRLYLPGNEPKFFINAGLHCPDGIILDLEDSVAPAEKDAARVLVRNALRAVDFLGAERMVRINQGERGLEDLEWVVPHDVHLILVPKVEHPRQIDRIQNRIEEIQEKHGHIHDIWLMPIVESALGAWRALEIATAADTVVALAIGLEDYTADIGAERTLAGTESFWARSQVLNGARAAGVQPIDTVFSDVNDMEGLRASVEEARSLGFVGKGCIHPRQIAVVHDAFAPKAEAVAKARQIVLAFEQAERDGLGVVALGSKMIDPPVVKRALATVASAIEAGKLDPDWRAQEAAERADQGGAA
jgi:citrate lyase subunit beta/citryl-CoA lyase